jgi:hypothetical protein
MMTATMTYNDCTDDDTIEQFALMSFATMACKKEEKFFSSTSCLLLLLLLLLLLSSFRTATKASHYMTTSSKTHRSAQPRC